MKVTFLPEGVSYSSEVPVLASEAAAQCDVLIEHPCGTRGRCTRCRVRFREGAPEPTEADRAKLSKDFRDQGWRLSCQALVTGDAVLEVPEASRATGVKSFGPERLASMGSTGGTGLGIAIDLGSTTVAAALVDIASTRVIAHQSALNDQVRFGGDVISRVRHAMDAGEGGSRLTEALRTTVAGLVDRLLRAAGVDASEVTTATACGNGAMSHAFAGESVVSLGLAPYHGTFTEAKELSGEDVGWRALPAARVRLFPQIASHVGGDTVAAILSTGIDRARRPELLVDLGTNTEIVLATPEGIVAASAAAGPAFEGAEITHGMRATPGAVDRVSSGVDRRLLLHTVGGVEPIGLCGTGLVDASATLLELGLIEAGGRLVGPGEAPTGLPAEIADRLQEGERGNHAYELAAGVALYALDVRQLQLVKGSIVAAIHLLLDSADISLADLGAVHVAGAFGTHLRKWTALRVGLVPAVDPERILMVGDAAAVGARMALCSAEAWESALDIARRARHVELATDPRYTDAFAAAIPFPDAFPDPVESRAGEP